MGSLSPLFLAAALAIGVPLFLHLFQRQETLRISFPALRYLERTERDHARRIRFRQLLLLLLRVAVLLLLVGAGARLFVHGRGSAHPPTAVVIVLDNSMSSGLVVGEHRVLDELRALARETLATAGGEDRFWVLRVGEPWVTAVPGGPSEASERVAQTQVSAAGGDLSGALAHAAELLRTSQLPYKEIHLLSDVQATAFGGEPRPAGAIPVVVWSPDAPPPANHALTGVVVGGGLPPPAGQRAEIAVSSLAAAGDTSVLPVRVVVDDRIRGAASLPAGAVTSITLPPAGSGWVRGYAESDPDALRADDRRYFAFHSRPPARVAVVGDPGIFVEQALVVLDSAGRLERAPAQQADVVVAASGEGLDGLGARSAALVLPPADATLLPALNRRLVGAGIPWRVEPRASVGQAELVGTALPAPLEQVRVSDWYRLSLAGEPAAPSRVLAEAGGDPWAVEGTDARGRPFLLLASPLEPGATSLPVSASMLQFVEWATAQWSTRDAGATSYVAGAALSAPREATHVRTPSGEVVQVDGTRAVTWTAEAGFYELLAADTVVWVAAVNPPAEESDLTRLPTRAFADRIGPETTEVDRAERWRSSIYRQRQGPEIWWPLVLAAAALLLAEAFVAASGQRATDAAKATRKVAPADAV